MYELLLASLADTTTCRKLLKQNRVEWEVNMKFWKLGTTWRAKWIEMVKISGFGWFPSSN